MLGIFIGGAAGSDGDTLDDGASGIFGRVGNDGTGGISGFLSGFMMIEKSGIY
jgi:hypothetical protein